MPMGNTIHRATLYGNILCLSLSQTYEQYLKMYQERLKETGYSFIINAEHCFDGVWSLAMAINATLTGNQSKLV